MPTFPKQCPAHNALPNPAALKVLLQHGLEILGHVERRLRLALDLLDGDAISDLDESEAVSNVDVKDTLGNTITLAWPFIMTEG